MQQTRNSLARPLVNEEQKVAILDDAQTVMINTVASPDNSQLRVEQERSPEEQKSECSICKKEIKENTSLDSCQHVFHLVCIK